MCDSDGSNRRLLWELPDSRIYDLFIYYGYIYACDGDSDAILRFPKDGNGTESGTIDDSSVESFVYGKLDDFDRPEDLVIYYSEYQY